MHDVIIIGARCGGSSLAMLLARKGAKVLFLDRATFPRDIPHGHYIHRHGPRRLRNWGLLERVAARTPAISNMIFDVGDFPLRVQNLVEDGVAWGYGPRRSTFDKIMVDAAVEGGAELREGFTVDDYIFDGDRLVGIRGRGRKGGPIEERATLTVGADGRNSALARAVQAPFYNYVPPLLCYYFSYWSGVESEQFELYDRSQHRRVIFSFKTEDDLYCVLMGMDIAELPQIRPDVDRKFMETLDRIPEFGARVRAGRREERYYGASDLPNFYRKPFGPGWALVGDAGIHKDPYLALGMCDALRDAELLATAICEGLSAQRPWGQALGDYEARRNQLSAREYEENLAAARFTPLPPEMLALRAAVRDKPEQATRMVKAIMGMTDPATFFNPENLERLLGGSRKASSRETGIGSAS